MAKAIKQVSTKTKAHKPAKKGKRKQAAKALHASAASVKRQAPPIGYDLDSWLAGYKAGLFGRPIEPPKRTAVGVHYKHAVDGASWLAGYIEGAGQLKARDVAYNIRDHGAGGAQDSDYCGLGSAPYCHGFMQGMRVAARQTWR